MYVWARATTMLNSKNVASLIVFTDKNQRCMGALGT